MIEQHGAIAEGFERSYVVNFMVPSHARHRLVKQLVVGDLGELGRAVGSMPVLGRWPFPLIVHREAFAFRKSKINGARMF